MPDLSQIEAFVLTSELGSLAAVARKLGVSSAAISKQLTRLEKELGVQLLLRSTRKIALTELGTSYCIQCHRILEEVDVASALISQVKAIPFGSLKIVSGRHFAAAFIVPHIKKFLQKYPKIELSLELAERMPDLDREEVDILIGMSLSASGEAIQKRIATTSYTYCASPDYLKKFGEPKKPVDLIKHRYIAHSMRKPDNELVFSNKEVIKLAPYIKVNDTQSMVNLALDGLGIVKLHHYVVKDLLESGKLQEILMNYCEKDVPIYVAFPNRRFVPAKVRCFIDFITLKMG